MCNISEIPEGRWGTFWGLILENPERSGDHTLNPFRGGGMDIFWNHTLFSYLVSSIIAQCCVFAGGASRSKTM